MQELVVKNSSLKFKDWKFWYKLFCGIIPFLCIIIFVSAQMYYVLTHDQPVYFDDKSKNTYNHDYLESLKNWTVGQRIEFVLLRNSLIFTTISNIAIGTFMINSAVNHLNEGKGKLDNWKAATVVSTNMMFVVLLYNISLPITGAVSVMLWSSYVTWMGEHLVVPIMSIVYVMFFYNTKEMKLSTKEKWKWSSISAFIPMSYMFIFSIVGLILQSSNAFPIFADMSYTGHFPYDFLDFKGTPYISFIPQWLQWLLLMSVFIGMGYGMYFAQYGIILKWRTLKPKLLSTELKVEKKIAKKEKNIKLDVEQVQK